MTMEKTTRRTQPQDRAEQPAHEAVCHECRVRPASTDCCQLDASGHGGVRGGGGGLGGGSGGGGALSIERAGISGRLEAMRQCS